jgi:guanylate kinase
LSKVQKQLSTRMIILAAPSGAGKSSFVERICREDERLVDTITYTTREMRKGEAQGHPYYFVSKEEFEQKIQGNFFIEWALVHTNLYGTPHYQIEEAWKQNKCIIMDVDVQGARTFKDKFPDAKTIFILPPSIDELRRRIEKRDGKIPADIEVRMANAEREMKEASTFDQQIVNDNFEKSYAVFKKIVDEWLKST